MMKRTVLEGVARIVAFALLACATFAHASMGTDQEHEVKAAFIANFIRFIDWPDLGPSGSDFIVGVYGADDFENTIDLALAGRSVSGHPIVVMQLHSDADIKKCRVVVSGASSADRIDQLSRLCSSSGTVLIGESTDFAKFGGTIGLLIIDSHVTYEINFDTAKRSRVTISSNLLHLAHFVYGAGP